MWRGGLDCGGDLLAFGDDNRVVYVLIERNDVVAEFPIGACVVKRANNRRIAALDNSRNPPQAASIAPRRRELHQHLVALHRAVDLIRWNKNVIIAGSLSRERPHKAVAIAVQVEASGHKIVARSAGDLAREAPHLSVE